MALALELRFWLYLSCLKPYLLFHFDSIMWPQLGSIDSAPAGCSVGSCNGLGSGVWTLLSLGPKAQLCCGPVTKMLGQGSFLHVGGNSAARANLQTASMICHWDMVGYTAVSCLFEYCLLIVDFVKAKSVVLNLTLSWLCLQRAMLRMPS